VEHVADCAPPPGRWAESTTQSLLKKQVDFLLKVNFYGFSLIILKPAQEPAVSDVIHFQQSALQFQAYGGRPSNAPRCAG
jgi:hypothetical protein